MFNVVLWLLPAGPEAKAAESIWAIGSIVERGAVVEERLGANLPRTFKTIDRAEFGAEGVATSITSIKSIDLGAKTYQSTGALISRLKGYVDQVANFSQAALGSARVVANDSTERILQVAIPDTPLSQERMEALQQIWEYGQEHMVSVEFIPMN